MASTRSRTDPAIPTLEEFGAEVLRRREAYKAKYGREFDLPRNSGENRTESKKALLKAIKDIGGKWRFLIPPLPSGPHLAFDLTPMFC